MILPGLCRHLDPIRDRHVVQRQQIDRLFPLFLQQEVRRGSVLTELSWAGRDCALAAITQGNRSSNTVERIHDAILASSMFHLSADATATYVHEPYVARPCPTLFVS